MGTRYYNPIKACFTYQKPNIGQRSAQDLARIPLRNPDPEKEMADFKPQKLHSRKGHTEAHVGELPGAYG